MAEPRRGAPPRAAPPAGRPAARACAAGWLCAIAARRRAGEGIADELASDRRRRPRVRAGVGLGRSTCRPPWRDRRPRLVTDNRGTSRYMLEGRLIPPGEGMGAWASGGHLRGHHAPRRRLRSQAAAGRHGRGGHRRRGALRLVRPRALAGAGPRLRHGAVQRLQRLAHRLLLRRSRAPEGRARAAAPGHGRGGWRRAGARSSAWACPR